MCACVNVCVSVCLCVCTFIVCVCMCMVCGCCVCVCVCAHLLCVCVCMVCVCCVCVCVYVHACVCVCVYILPLSHSCRRLIGVGRCTTQLRESSGGCCNIRYCIGHPNNVGSLRHINSAVEQCQCTNADHRMCRINERVIPFLTVINKTRRRLRTCCNVLRLLRVWWTSFIRKQTQVFPHSHRFFVRDLRTVRVLSIHVSVVVSRLW